jgi:hypothetical protein
VVSGEKASLPIVDFRRAIRVAFCHVTVVAVTGALGSLPDSTRKSILKLTVA